MYREREVNFWVHGICLSINQKTQQEFLKGILDSIKHFSLLFLLSKRRREKTSPPYALLEQKKKKTNESLMKSCGCS